MQYLYDPDSGKNELLVEGENYKYLIKVRRFKPGKELGFRNLKDNKLYIYRLCEVNKKEAKFTLKDAIQKESKKSKSLHILWCIIDPKSIYQTLPMLNQVGVDKISFIYCQRSQRSFKLDLKRIEKILINSSQQCGRGDLMEVEIIDNLEKTIDRYPNFAVLDFGGECNWKETDIALIGCEGGFSDDEKNILLKHPKIGLKTTNILKSETAVLSFSIKSLI
jgi:16S rRNA (uracil1498-N3)-methyltransferase